MIRTSLFLSCLLLIAMSLAVGSDRDHPFWKYKARDENRWLLEKLLGKKYWNDNHKRAVKAAREENWGMSLLEYEAAFRSVGLSLQDLNQPGDAGNVTRAEIALLEIPSLNSLRFELAIAYANRADELHSFGRSEEADSLAELAIFFLEHVKVYGIGPWEASASFARLASAFSRLGKHERAVNYYRSALILIEDKAQKSDPLQAVVNIRLGQEYLLLQKTYESEPPLLRGTEFADSATAADSKNRSWCNQLAAEGRAFLAESCRRMDRYAEAESLYAEAMQLALYAKDPMILPQCRPLFENYAKLLRAKGNYAEADSVNYRTDLIQRRAEAEVTRITKEVK